MWPLPLWFQRSSGAPETGPWLVESGEGWVTWAGLRVHQNELCWSGTGVIVLRYALDLSAWPQCMHINEVILSSVLLYSNEFIHIQCSCTCRSMKFLTVPEVVATVTLFAPNVPWLHLYEAVLKLLRWFLVCTLLHNRLNSMEDF